MKKSWWREYDKFWVGVLAGVIFIKYVLPRVPSLGFAGHFPMPDFVAPTYFEQATRLLDPNRG